MLHMGYPCNPNSNPVKKLSTLLWHNWTVTQSNPNSTSVIKGLSTVTYQDCDTNSMVHMRPMTHQTLWHTGYATQKEDPNYRGGFPCENWNVYPIINKFGGVYQLLTFYSIWAFNFWGVMSLLQKADKPVTLNHLKCQMINRGCVTIKMCLLPLLFWWKQSGKIVSDSCSDSCPSHHSFSHQMFTQL